MGAMASQISSLTIVYWTVYSGADQRKHQSSASLAFVRWIHRWPVNSPHKEPVTRKMFPFDDVVMSCVLDCSISSVPPMESLQSWLWPACISQLSAWWGGISTLRPRQNGRLFADDTFKRIFLNENIGISIKISLKFVPKGLINNIPALVLIMAWRRPGDKPLSEPMMVRSLTHICITRPQ